MGINQLDGTSWHIERLHRSEGDERRYKGRCQYYHYLGERCSFRNTKCFGCSHCDHYKAISDEEFNKKRKAFYRR